MSIPAKQLTDLLKQFDQLIDEGNAIKESVVHNPAVEGYVPNPVFYGRHEKRLLSPEMWTWDDERLKVWVCRCATFLDHAVPKASIHDTWIRGLLSCSSSLDLVHDLLPKLKALRSDFALGLFDSLVSKLEAAVAADYMSQADELLNQGGSGVHDHVPAAVLAGATLENRMRSKCGEQKPPIETVLPNGKKKMLNILIDDLKNAGHYNESRAKQLRAWAAIRNHAAHGEFDQFSRTDVEHMLNGMKSFLDELN